MPYPANLRRSVTVLQCTPNSIFLLTCQNFLLSLCLSSLTVVRVFAGELEKGHLGISWFPALLLRRISGLIFSLLRFSFLLDAWAVLPKPGSSSASPKIYSGAPVPQVWVGPTTALGINLILNALAIHLIWPLSTGQSLLNCKFLGMGRKKNPFLTFPYPPDHLKLFSPATMG